MIDREASIRETKENAEQYLGRTLTASEEAEIESRIDSEIVTEQQIDCVATIMFPFVVLCGILFVFQKATEFVVSVYMSYADPFVMWMVQPHTDSILNLILQIYMWIIVPPILLCFAIVLFLPILSGACMYCVSLVFGCLMNARVGVFWSILFLLGGTLLRLAALIGVFVVPLIVLKNTAARVGGVVFRSLGSVHRWIKDKVFRLTDMSLGVWFLFTHIVIPIILISLVAMFASDKVRLQHRANGNGMSTSSETSPVD